MEDKLETLHMIVKYDVLALITKIDTYCEIYDIPYVGLELSAFKDKNVTHKIILRDDHESFDYI